MTLIRKLPFMLLALYAVPAPAAPNKQAKVSPLESRIDAYLQPVLRTNNFSGVVAIAKSDQVVFQKAYGYANIEHKVRHTPRTLFHIASVSKPFTAAAIMRLVDRGKIDLHAPLTKILPGYPNGDKLTVHHLLAHTSGIPNINNFPDYDEIQSHRRTPAELVANFKDKPLSFEPGARYSYSNSNYNLLALIIERISGKSYRDFLDEEIIRPTGLTHTAHPRDMSDIIPGLADGYAARGMTGLERARYIDWSVKTGNGSLHSTAADLVRFFRAIHTGSILTSQSLKASFTPHTPNVGYGWFLTTANNREIHHINGRQPGWAAQSDYYVKEGVSVIVLSNTYSSVTTPIARAVGAIYFGEKHQPFPNLGAKLNRSDITPVVGDYRFGPDYPVPNALMHIVTREGDVYAEVEGQPPAAFIPLGDNRFIIRPYWVEAEFVIGPDGTASELKIDPFKGSRTR